MSEWVAEGTVAIEDRRFYQHGGIDVAGIIRAAFADVRAARSSRAAPRSRSSSSATSTTCRRSNRSSRKLKEACLAVKVDRSWTKQRQLAGYLNFVYYGNRAYGIEAAAQTYFSKPAKDLTLRESALLAGLPQAPSEFDPFKRPAGARARPAQRGPAGDAQHRRDHAGAVQESVEERQLGLKAGSLYTEIKEPYFFVVRA